MSQYGTQTHTRAHFDSALAVMAALPKGSGQQTRSTRNYLNTNKITGLFQGVPIPPYDFIGKLNRSVGLFRK